MTSQNNTEVLGLGPVSLRNFSCPLSHVIVVEEVVVVEGWFIVDKVVPNTKAEVLVSTKLNQGTSESNNLRS